MANRYRETAAASSNASAGGWDLEDARTRFDESVRNLLDADPQCTIIKGQDAAAISIEEDIRKFGQAATPIALPFVDFMESLHVGEIDLAREPVRCEEPDR